MTRERDSSIKGSRPRCSPTYSRTYGISVWRRLRTWPRMEAVVQRTISKWEEQLPMYNNCEGGNQIAPRREREWKKWKTTHCWSDRRRVFLVFFTETTTTLLLLAIQQELSRLRHWEALCRSTDVGLRRQERVTSQGDPPFSPHQSAIERKEIHNCRWTRLVAYWGPNRLQQRRLPPPHPSWLNIYKWRLPAQQRGNPRHTENGPQKRSHITWLAMAREPVSRHWPLDPNLLLHVSCLRNTWQCLLR